MENYGDRLNDLKILLSSSFNQNKSSAYSKLLHLQEQSITDSSLIQALADSSRALLSSILIDISYEDEEIATLALKCLGFMIYHPSIVDAISATILWNLGPKTSYLVGPLIILHEQQCGEDAYKVMDSLEKVIITTKIKSVCNLGVWCISIQQLNASYLEGHFNSLLRAVVHALDNPIGSLSTTFEAIQAVMKLATQVNEKMRETSNIWAPPIYRRLISTDKREKDMAERCLLKIRPTVCPPTASLSKVLATNLKRKLLSAMKELLNQGMKTQALRAWGWFIRLMGPYAVKNKHLVNEMLKIPEQTFSDSDPQVQIASQVAWEGLIDALINPPIPDPDTKADMEHRNMQMRASEAIDSGLEAIGTAKSIKLIMTPLVGIMSSKCDPSVHSSCLNTWSYLLHKLDIFVNSPAVRKTALEPILEVVFRAGPHGRNLPSWNFCLDLLDNLSLARSEDPSIEMAITASDQLSAKSPTIMRKHYPIKWMAWDISQLDFYIRMIQNLACHGFLAGVTQEIKTFACNAAFRIFQSALVGVRIELKRCSISHNEVMLCLNTIVMFLKQMYEDADSDGDAGNDMCQTSLRFIELTIEELETSTLGSPLYKLMIDVKYIDNSEQDNEFLHAKGLSIFSGDETDMVSPVEYLTILYFRIMLQLTSSVPRMSRYVRLLLSSYEVPDILHALTGLLYKNLLSNCLNIWMAIANGLKDYIEGIKDLSAWKTEFDSTGYLFVSHLLSYPFVLFARSMTQMKSTRFLETSPLLLESQNKLEFGDIAVAWKSLYVSVDHKLGLEYSTSKNFSEDLSSMLSDCMDEYISMLVSGTELAPTEKTRECDLVCLCGDVASCLMERILASHVCCEGSKNKDNSGGFRRISCRKNSLGFVARFLRLSYMKAVTNTQIVLDATSRVFSVLVRFIDSLRSSEDIIPFVEIISSPLVEWLSNADLQNKSTSHELQQLWVQTLSCVQKSWPPVNFNSTLLKLQAPLLEATLDHKNPSVSKPTITFWNSTYGAQSKLDYPQCLLPVLDKLSRTGKINLCRRSQQYKVSATLNRCSKRVELVEGEVENGCGSKRKRTELTEHQKEVRRAQQGRSLDCEGRGPGFRTYTSVDFSQGNEESQDSQDIPNVDSILEMLKRDG